MRFPQSLRCLPRILLLFGSISTLSTSATTTTTTTSDQVVLRQKKPIESTSCPGYVAKNVKWTSSSSTLTADLELAGRACDVYGLDIYELRLEVSYDTKTQLHVRILDPKEKRYEVPEEVFPRPKNEGIPAEHSELEFKFVENPFSFKVVRKSTGEKLFDTTGHALVFENQYLRVKTNLPEKANIYGLGEHSEALRLDTVNTTRTLWARDAPGIPRGSNLYGVHPVYYEHRKTGTHGVFLLNSNGMDVKLRENQGTTLEYNVIGGILDFYFFAGPSPVAVAQQYAKVAGLPAMPPYWGLGLHQCRWGYRDWIDVAEVIANYSKAEIPLETMWTDIDYMDKRWIMTVDPENYPLERVREIVNYLHSHNQHYILMVDPAVGQADYPTFNRGVKDGIFMKTKNGTIYDGVVWPGVTAYPDWFHPDVGKYWDNEFRIFFDAEKGVDIDGVWIDMNEPANFCDYPCIDPAQTAKDRGMPPPARPKRDPPRPIPGFTTPRAKRQLAEDLINPPYSIANDFPNGISDKTAATDIIHANGLREYDVHNLYGTMMSMATREAMLSLRPGLRPLIITRSTFAGAGKSVGKWLGDNISLWEHYRYSIAGMLGFASFYQIPLVGSDICGFGGNTTETLCARWATLGAFNPFYRNHNIEEAIPQEFYRWDSVAAAAKKAIDIRYRLLDYIYTAIHKQSIDGTPALNPLFFAYPQDEKTFGIDMQFLYGPSVLVSPVLDENSTSVEIYLPNDIFYDFETLAPVVGEGKNVTLSNIGFDTIPLHIRGGAVLPLRVESAMTTTELREKDFALIVAPGLDGTASGSLYLDDGVSIEQQAISDVSFKYTPGKLDVRGEFGFGAAAAAACAGIKVKSIMFLSVKEQPQAVYIGGTKVPGNRIAFDGDFRTLCVTAEIPLTKRFTVRF